MSNAIRYKSFKLQVIARAQFLVALSDRMKCIEHKGHVLCLLPTAFNFKGRPTPDMRRALNGEY